MISKPLPPAFFISFSLSLSLSIQVSPLLIISIFYLNVLSLFFGSGETNLPKANTDELKVSGLSSKGDDS